MASLESFFSPQVMALRALFSAFFGGGGLGDAQSSVPFDPDVREFGDGETAARTSTSAGGDRRTGISDTSGADVRSQRVKDSAAVDNTLLDKAIVGRRLLPTDRRAAPVDKTTKRPNTGLARRIAFAQRDAENAASDARAALVKKRRGLVGDKETLGA
jgi:hypothetical protein